MIARASWLLAAALSLGGCGDDAGFCAYERQVGTRCNDGVVETVWRIDCLQRCDLQPDSRSTCNVPDARYACRTNACNPDAVFAPYAGALNGRTPYAPPEYILRLACLEGRAHTAGDACAIDDDCRPSADRATRLRCDAASGRCVATARPAAPANCSLRCEYDEDCPEGSTCPLPPPESWSRGFSVCAPVMQSEVVLPACSG